MDVIRNERGTFDVLCDNGQEAVTGISSEDAAWQWADRHLPEAAAGIPCPQCAGPLVEFKTGDASCNTCEQHYEAKDLQ